MLSYNITNWSEAPGPREARVVVGRRDARVRVQRIARALGERDTPNIHRAIQVVTARLGYERAVQLIDEARAIFSGAGMQVRDRSRLRSLGGIFFQLARGA